MHDRTKHSLCAKVVELESTDPRCKNLPNGMIRMQCDTCSFLPTVRNTDASKKQARHQAKMAHKPPDSSLVAGRAAEGAPEAPTIVDNKSAKLPLQEDSEMQRTSTEVDSATSVKSSSTEERTVGEKRDRRDMKEVLTSKRKEYYPDGTLKAEIEESKETTDKGESVSTEIRELRTRVIELEQQITLSQMKVERTFKTLVEKKVATRLDSERKSYAKLLDRQIANQSLSAKGAKPMDVYLLAKIVNKQCAMLSDLVEASAASDWLTKNADDLGLFGVPQQLEDQPDYQDLVELACQSQADIDAAFRSKLPLLSNLGFSSAHLDEWGLWPRPKPDDPTPVEGCAGVEDNTSIAEEEPPDGRRFPSPIDRLPPEAWTSEVLTECLGMTGEAMYTRPLEPEKEARQRQDPPKLIGIISQHIRTTVFYKDNDPDKVIRNRKILAVLARFEHPSGDAVDVQVDVHDLTATYNRPHYKEQVRLFFSKNRALSTV